MLTQNTLVQQLRPLLHPMLVHFPIALLFASVALDWLGYLSGAQHPPATGAGGCCAPALENRAYYTGATTGCT